MNAKCRMCKNKPQKGGSGLCSVHYRRKLAYRGVPQGWVDATDALVHITRLRRAGMRMRRIAELIEMSEDSVYKIANGTRTTILAATEAKILAIESPSTVTAELPSHAHILALGTARRIRALNALGYSFAEIGRHAGKHRQSMLDIACMKAKLVHVGTAKAVSEAFARLQMLPPPEGPEAKRARTLAKRKGWTTLPFDWDEEDIDIPGTRPRVMREQEGDWLAEYDKLRQKGLTQEQVARRMGINPATLLKRLERLRAA